MAKGTFEKLKIQKECSKCMNSTGYFPPAYFHLHHITYEPEEKIMLCLNCHSLITALNTFYVYEVNKGNKKKVKKFKRKLTSAERQFVFRFFLKDIPISCNKKMAIYLLRKYIKQCKRQQLRQQLQAQKEKKKVKHFQTKLWGYWNEEEYWKTYNEKITC